LNFAFAVIFLRLLWYLSFSLKSMYRALSFPVRVA
jgi:hypothetical protein